MMHHATLHTLKLSLMAGAFGLLSLITGCDQITDSAPKLSFGSGTSNAVVIDLDAIAKALGKDEQLRTQLQSANEELGTQVTELAEGLKIRLQDERTKLGEEPSLEAQQDFRKLATQAQLQLRRGQQVARQRSQQVQRELIRSFRAEVTPFAQKAAADRGASIVLLKPTVLWSADLADITNEVARAMTAVAPKAESSQ